MSVNETAGLYSKSFWDGVDLAPSVWKEFLSVTPAGLLIVNNHGSILYSNDYISRKIKKLKNEFTLDEIFGSDIHEIKEIIDLLCQNQCEVLPRSIEVTSPRVVWLVSPFVPSFLKDRNAAALISVDITAHRRLEERLIRSERRHRLASKTSSDYLFSYKVLEDGDHELEWVAGAFEKITGYKNRDIMTKEGWVKFIYHEDLPKVRRYAEQLNKNCGETLEHRILTKKGHIKWLRVKVEPFFDKTLGRVTELFGSAEDITLEKNAEKNRISLLEGERRARREAEKANQAKDDFLSLVSHELRTPLNAILGWTQLLRSKPFTHDRLTQGLGIIERSTRTQGLLIEDLLNMGQIKLGKLTLTEQVFDICSLVRAEIEAIQPTAEAQNIRVFCTASHEQTFILGDQSRMRQVLGNLITNSLKFTPKDGTITVSVIENAETVMVEVKDSGRGINADFLPYIFDKFRQGESGSTRTKGGLGLGLAIVKQLVELHGGSIKVDSKGKDKGAEFIISLPKFKDGPEIYSRNSSPTFNSKALRGKKILVVDDAVDAAEFMQRILEEYEARVKITYSVKSALSLLAEEIPDLIISDISMPDEDGYQFLRQVRMLGSRKGGEVPAIAVTALDRPEDRERVLQCGYQLHLTKPIEVSKLLIGVAKALTT